MDDGALRYEIYRSFAATGRAPTVVELSEGQDEVVVRSALRRLHEAHAVVLDDLDQVSMALPFATRDTGHRVRSGQGSWWANCAWDSLAIPAALAVDADIDATWLDTGQPVELGVRDGELTDTDGWVHFAVPARRWWDDIVET